jgi:hypothetical protein
LEAPYDEAEDVLRALSASFKIGVTANQSVSSPERLTKWGLMPYISTCLCSFELGLEKPDPAIFKLALDRAGCAASQAVIIGDRLDNDIRPARLLGWKTIRVLQGFARFQSRGTCGMSQILAAREDAYRLSTLISFFILRQTSSTSATGGVLPAETLPPVRRDQDDRIPRSNHSTQAGQNGCEPAANPNATTSRYTPAPPWSRLILVPSPCVKRFSQKN